MDMAQRISKQSVLVKQRKPIEPRRLRFPFLSIQKMKRSWAFLFVVIAFELPRIASSFSLDKYSGNAVNFHNDFRNNVSGYRGISWDSQLSEYASTRATNLAANGACVLSHDNLKHGYGENLYMSQGQPDSSQMGTQLSNAMESWSSEVANRNFQDYKNFNGDMSIGHATQMLARRTHRLGCGAAISSCGVVISCNYQPAGNMVGKPLDEDDSGVPNPEAEPTFAPAVLQPSATHIKVPGVVLQQEGNQLPLVQAKARSFETIKDYVPTSTQPITLPINSQAVDSEFQDEYSEDGLLQDGNEQNVQFSSIDAVVGSVPSQNADAILARLQKAAIKSSFLTSPQETQVAPGMQIPSLPFDIQSDSFVSQFPSNSVLFATTETHMIAAAPPFMEMMGIPTLTTNPQITATPSLAFLENLPNGSKPNLSLPTTLPSDVPMLTNSLNGTSNTNFLSSLITATTTPTSTTAINTSTTTSTTATTTTTTTTTTTSTAPEKTPLFPTTTDDIPPLMGIKDLPVDTANNISQRSLENTGNGKSSAGLVPLDHLSKNNILEKSPGMRAITLAKESFFALVLLTCALPVVLFLYL